MRNLLNYMRENRRRRDQRTALLLGGGCLVLLVLGVFTVIIGSIFSVVETANVVSAYGETYAQTCRSLPTGDTSLDNLPDGEPPRGVLLLTTQTQRRHAWHSDLPPQWRADDADQLSLIGCVTEEERVLETCNYQRAVPGEEPFTISIDRVQYETTIVLVNPDTARRIDSMTVTGSIPEECPPDEDVNVSGTRSGTEVPWEAFAAWIEGYVFEA